MINEFYAQNEWVYTDKDYSCHDYIPLGPLKAKIDMTSKTKNRKFDKFVQWHKLTLCFAITLNNYDDVLVPFRFEVNVVFQGLLRMNRSVALYFWMSYINISVDSIH